jgi:hypothetical protein
VKALVPGDELVGEGEPGHEAALLEPVDGAEGAGEEDALDARERDEALGEVGGAVRVGREGVSRSVSGRGGVGRIQTLKANRLWVSVWV